MTYRHSDSIGIMQGGQVRIRTVAEHIWPASPGVLWASMALAIGALLVIGCAEHSLIASFTIWLFCGTIGTILLSLEGIGGRFPKLLIRMFWVTFSLRIFVMALLHFGLGATSYAPWWDFGSGGGDEAGFWSNSERLFEAWRHGNILDERAGPYDNYFCWLQIIGFIRFIGAQLDGESVFNVRLVLCMAGALVVPYVYAMAMRLFDERVAILSAILAFWLPDYWFYSATLMRDVLNSCVMVIIYYQVVAMFYGRFRLWRLFLAVGLNFGVMRFLRADVAYFNVAVIGLFAIWADLGKYRPIIVRMVMVVSLGVVLWGVMLIVLPQSYSLKGLSTNRFLRYEHIHKMASGRVELGLREASSDSLGAKLLQISPYWRWPLASIVVLLQPIPPWAAFQGGINWFPLKMIATTVSAFVWYFLVAFLPVGFVGCLSGRARKSVWVWGTALLLVLAFGFGTGDHSRWRLILQPFLLIMIAQGMLIWRQHRLLFQLTVMSILSGLVVYSVLKYTI